MGLFGKKESNAEYQALKNDAINSWKYLVSDNPFASADELKNKWSSVYQKINKAYKASQKYLDTEKDVSVLKAYLDDAVARINEYTLEIEYDKYRKEYLEVCNEYEELIEEQYNPSGVWNDNYELMSRYEKLHKRAGWLQNQLPRFRRYDIDERVIKDINSNSAFYYCASILRLTENKEDDPDERKRDAYYQYLRKCEAVAKSLSEGRFKAMKGIACNRRALFIQETSNRRGYESGDSSVINSLLHEAKPFLSIVESADYCYAVAKKHTGYSILNDWEWSFMITAMEDLCNIYKYEKNYPKARAVVNVSIEAHQKANVLGDWNNLINSLIAFRNGII